jgi:hypothetical protein
MIKRRGRINFEDISSSTSFRKKSKIKNKEEEEEEEDTEKREMKATRFENNSTLRN